MPLTFALPSTPSPTSTASSMTPSTPAQALFPAGASLPSESCVRREQSRHCHFELPGLTKEAVSLDVRDNMLSVSGESTISAERDEKGYAGIKPEEIKASMTDGVLTVTFPRTTPEQAPQKVKID
ncbi:uncharacterized protein BXZ73DRAFT_102836 [Epithele typhae]|uniref:uncharacterized protein n=1 Tax=Epithele typhae TaxID=378194 RepID=UPI0020073C71|nr:uncharacterized protein BXZ73DRAFT_102836 [Epithele typhae]KAH9926576.1 hypothetical protein BXZ73DRAFT_102836 [Epithele typhae]